jgi:hypothetical protein
MATQDEMLAGLLGGIPGGPLTTGLLATSAGLLSAGGPSYEPRSFGGALGAGMMSGLNAYQQAQQNSLSQYVAATKLAQQMRQQEAINSLAANMDPRQRAVLLANPEAATGAMAKDFWTKTDLDKKIGDYTRNLNHPDPLVRDAAVAQLSAETPQFKALVARMTAGASERGRFDAVSTGELAARAGAEAGAREAATLPFAGPRAAAIAAGSFYSTPQRIGDNLVMIPAPGAPTLPGAPRMGAGAPQPGGGAPGAPAVPGAPAGQPGAPSVVYSAPRDPEKTASMEDSARQNFVKMPEVANYKEVVSAFNSATTAGNTLAGDLNLVYAFAKAMDPGSVVREGEQVMIQRTGGVFDRLKGMVDSITGGARLTPEIRMALMNELNTRVLSLQQQHDSVRAQYEALARQRGLNVDNVIDKAPTINLPIVRSQADVDRLMPGQMYRDHQGNLRVRG